MDRVFLYIMQNAVINDSVCFSLVGFGNPVRAAAPAEEFHLPGEVTSGL